MTLKVLLLGVVAGSCAITAAAPATAIAPPPTPKALPPLPRPGPSPVTQFRELLAMDEQELAATLADRPESRRRPLESKIREYKALPVQQREVRLRATELRWYLRPLLTLTPSDRASRLARIPEDYRSMIKVRLERWDSLAPDLRQELLENERTIHYVLGTGARLPPSPLPADQGLSPEAKARFDRELARWRSMPADRRSTSYAHFRQFFELDTAERARILRALPENESGRVEATLEAFAQMPPAQRQACLDAFRRLSRLTPEEQTQFLHSANRWREMTPAEREAWRRLTQRMPPLPPGLGFSPSPSLVPNPPPLPDLNSRTSSLNQAEG